jgi:mono/diheme cytochrome c family protein
MRCFAGLFALLLITPMAASGADLKAGQKAYEEECKGCHLMNGAAAPTVAKKMKAKGVNMRDLKDKAVQAQTDAEWRKMIVEGIGKMEAVKALGPADVNNVIAFMRTLKK